VKVRMKVQAGGCTVEVKMRIHAVEVKIRVRTIVRGCRGEDDSTCGEINLWWR
jgi:hypothetical protein